MKDDSMPPRPVNWHEGMLLMPQHFQQNDLKNDLQLKYHLDHSTYFHWGLIEFEYDKAAVINGVFRLLKLKAIMPDGLIVNFNNQVNDDEVELELRREYFSDEGEEYSVYLSVLSREAGNNKTESNERRYQSVEGEENVDISTGKDSVRISRLVPKLYLFFGEEPSSKYTSLPLMKFKLIEDNFIVCDYDPPQPRMMYESKISHIVKEIVYALKEKTSSVADKLKCSSGAADLSQVVELKFIVKALSSQVPELESLYHIKAHPYHLYLILCSIVGELSALGASIVPPRLPVYEHDNLLFHYNLLKDYIISLIEESFCDSYDTLSFNYQKGRFSIVIRSDWLDGDLLIGVRRNKDKTSAETIQWVEECIIASEPRIKSLKEMRVLGVEREKIDETNDLPAFSNVIYFVLNKDRNLILANEKLIVFNINRSSKEDMPAEIILFTRKAGSEA